jgi:hypothetical protein
MSYIHSEYLSVRNKPWANLNLMLDYNARTTSDFTTINARLNDEYISRLYTGTLTIVTSIAAIYLFKKEFKNVGVVLGLTALIPVSQTIASWIKSNNLEKERRLAVDNLKHIFTSIQQYFITKTTKRVNAVVEQFRSEKANRDSTQARKRLKELYFEDDQFHSVVTFSRKIGDKEFLYPEEIGNDLINKVRDAARGVYKHPEDKFVLNEGLEKTTVDALVPQPSQVE